MGRDQRQGPGKGSEQPSSEEGLGFLVRNKARHRQVSRLQPLFTAHDARRRSALAQLHPARPPSG